MTTNGHLLPRVLSGSEGENPQDAAWRKLYKGQSSCSLLKPDDSQRCKNAIQIHTYIFGQHYLCIYVTYRAVKEEQSHRELT